MSYISASAALGGKKNNSINLALFAFKLTAIVGGKKCSFFYFYLLN